MNAQRLKAASEAQRSAIRQLKKSMIDIREALAETADNTAVDLYQLQSLHDQAGAEFRDFIAWLGQHRKGKAT